MQNQSGMLQYKDLFTNSNRIFAPACVRRLSRSFQRQGGRVNPGKNPQAAEHQKRGGEKGGAGKIEAGVRALKNPEELGPEQWCKDRGQAQHAGNRLSQLALRK